MKSKLTSILLIFVLITTVYTNNIYAAAGWDRYRTDPTYTAKDRDYYNKIFDTDGELVFGEGIEIYNDYKKFYLSIYIRDANENISYIKAGQKPLEDGFMLPYHEKNYLFSYIVFDRCLFKNKFDNLKYINFGDINAVVLTHAFHGCDELSAVRFGHKTVTPAPFFIPNLTGLPMGGSEQTDLQWEKRMSEIKEYVSNSNALQGGTGKTVFVTKAFCNCPKLNTVVIDGSETFFDTLAFYKCGENLVIYCPENSAAEECARRDGINTIIIPEMSDTEKKIFDAEGYYPYALELADIVTPDDEEILYAHWLNYGLPNGINASKYFNVQKYLEYNADVRAAYGGYYVKAYRHFINYGIAEGRNSGGESLAQYIYGDTDADGKITSSDAALLMQKVLTPDIKITLEKKTGNFLKYADTDKDGILTASDALEIQQKVLNENYKMPCER